MRSYPALALLLSVALATPLGAQGVESDSASLRVAADAQPACVIDVARAGSAANAIFASNQRSGGTITISELVDPATAQSRASSIELVLPVICNAAHRVSVASSDGGLQRIGGSRGLRASADGFGDLLPYSLQFDWAGTSVSGTSDQARFEISEGAAQGEFRLQISTAANAGFLTAGSYGDTLTVQFEPAD